MPSHRKSPPRTPSPPPRAPSARITAALAAAMLAAGIVVGAAIGPAPSPSFALGRLLPLLPALVGDAARAHQSAAKATAGPEGTPAPAPPSPSAAAGTGGQSSAGEAGAATEAQPASTAPATSAPKRTGAPTGASGVEKASKLQPVTKVWLIELANSSFAEAAAQPSAASYIDTQALPAGTLLGRWSAIDASALASDAASIASTPPQLLDTIVQPPCPESASLSESASPSASSSPSAGDATAPAEAATSESCAPDTPGALTAASEFLAAALPTITSTAAYRENGLIVVTFASTAPASEAGLPDGASTATLTSQPPAGALLISPFVAAGASSSAAFDTTAPKRELERLLRR